MVGGVQKRGNAGARYGKAAASAVESASVQRLQWAAARLDQSAGSPSAPAYATACLLPLPCAEWKPWDVPEGYKVSWGSA